MTDYDEIPMRVPKGLVPKGCTLEWRAPKSGEVFVSSDAEPLIATAWNDWSQNRPVIVPPFDLAAWWPTWLLAEKIVWQSFNGGEWIVGDGDRFYRLPTTVVDLDFSVLDKSKVYHNPHREAKP